MGSLAAAPVLLAALVVAGCDGAVGSSTLVPSASSAAPVATVSLAPTAIPSLPPSAAATLAPTPVPSDGTTAGQERTDAFGIEQVWVPAGTFTMGTTAKQIAVLKAQGPPDWVASEFPSEVPAHQVTLSKGYWIDATEVSNGPPRFAFVVRRQSATASMTESGTCVPPGPSKKASGRCSAVNRARTASVVVRTRATCTGA